MAWISSLYDIVLFHPPVFADAFVLALWTKAYKIEGTSEFLKELTYSICRQEDARSVGFPHWLYSLPLCQDSVWSTSQTGSAVFSQKGLSFYW